MRHLLAGLLAVIAGLAVGLSDARADPPRPPAAAFPPEDGAWRMPARDFANTRYSGLDEINRDNVGSLRVAFTFSMGVMGGQESAPIVADNTMFVVSPYPTSLRVRRGISDPSSADAQSYVMAGAGPPSTTSLM